MTTSKLKAITPHRSIFDEDAALVARSKMDLREFSVLYDRYVQSVYRYLFYRIGSVAEAEDLTSQTFLAALEALPRYRHQGNFAAWLFRIARGKAIDYVRKQQKQLPLEDEHPADTPDLLAEISHTDEIARLSALIRSLGEDEQELIRLRYTAGLPFAQIAAILDRNENTVKKCLYRVVARLQTQMEESCHG